MEDFLGLSVSSASFFQVMAKAQKIFAVPDNLILKDGAIQDIPNPIKDFR
jgi:hypothetical protein